LPGAALAMYRCARPEKRRAAGGLLLSAALTSMLTGITEPLEFTVLVVAPAMYAVHSVYAGLAYMLMHLFDVGVGMTFSGGVIDLVLFGVLQGNARTHWLRIAAVGVGYFFLYYFTFLAMIRKMDLRTPGREEDEGTRLYTRTDFAQGAGLCEQIVEGLGGRQNLMDVDCCATRLRVTVADESLVSDRLLKESGASGVLHSGNGIQVVYGPRVSVIKSALMDYLEGRTAAVPAAPAEPKPAPGTLVLGACMNGRVVKLEEVADAAFSSGALGEGVAFEPADGHLYAPADGEIVTVMTSGHAVGMTTPEGAELLMHIGIDTVKLGGKHFESHVAAGQAVHRGDLLITFDPQAIREAGYPLVTPMTVCNSDEYAQVRLLAEGELCAGAPVLEIRGRAAAE
ncbi:MAG: PTS glucose transporter subunit IIA, partial [Oscillospiraceae bacterium]|nr:PTS glucose transporter subunit IIA [Oscillospiraceae bacterium]